MNSNNVIRVSLAFARLPDLKLLGEAETISASLFGNPNFPSPPSTKEEFDLLIGSFRTKLALRPEGGPTATALKNEARSELVVRMRELAFYVQVTSENVLSVLLSSGFRAMSRNRASEPLPTPVIERLVHGQSGEVLLTAGAIANARGFEREISVVNADGSFGPFQPLGFTKGCRRLSATGLVPGQRYAFRIRAMGGSTDQSDWSEVMTIMCL